MATIFFVAIILLLIGYGVQLQTQLHSMNCQLKKRLDEKTRQPLSIGLINPELNRLAANINNSLKAEEILRLNGIREEKQFKELIADISHDLRTPLTVIKGYQQLMEKSELNEDQRRKLQIAEKHADELEALIEQFFEYSCLLNTEVEPNIERLNLSNLGAECLADSVAFLEESNLSVSFEEGPAVVALVDKEMTIRILNNLIRNCRAHSAGNIRVSIQTEKFAVISFRNPVRTPDEIDVNRLFDRFYTADKARGKTTGLGLSIVRLLAEQMGGSAKATLDANVLEIRVELPLWENFVEVK